MAGAALVVGGAGVASAEPVSAQGQTSSNALGNYMSYTRTVSNGTPVYGDTVTITNRLERRGGTNSNLVFWIKDLHDDCLDYVDGSARWTVSGDTYTQGSKPNEVSISGTELEINPPALNSWAPPIEMSAEFVVNCNAGPLPTGGIDWDGTTMDANSASRTVGPTINVLRKGTSVFLHEPVNPQVNQQVSLRAITSYVPDGSKVVFTVDGESVGEGTVSNGEAVLPWTPSTAGDKVVRATFAQTSTHGASTSQQRTVTVSPTNEDSSVEVTAAGSPQVGQSTRITAEVTPAGAGGTAEFLIDGTVIGTVPVQADGTAALNWIPQESGERTIDVNFSGRPGVNPSTGALGVNVSAADPSAEATSTSLATVPTTAAGEQIVLTATVTPPNASGSVAFYDGEALIGTAPVVNGVATFEWTPDAEGARTIRAEFSPAGNFLASQDTTQAVVTPQPVDEEPEPTDPGASGSLGSLTGSLGS